MKIKLAEALLRRKELLDKVAVLKQINQPQLFETVMQRRQVNETIDDIAAKVPKLTASQVTAEYDFYARQLRQVDAVIQQANWVTEVTVKDEMMTDYQKPE